MKNLLKILIAIAVAITVVSCRKELNLKELGNYKNKIVLNGLIYADSTGSVNVTKSIGILDSENKQVLLENATVTMTNGNKSMYSFQYDSGGYYSLKENRFIAGETYELTASSNGFSTVSSSFIIPYKTTLVSIDTSVTYDRSPDCLSCELSQTLKLKMNLNSSTSQKEYIIVSLYRLDTVFSNKYNGDTVNNDDISWIGKVYNTFYSYDKNLKLVKTNKYLEEVFDDGYYYSGYELYFEKPEGETDYNITVYDYNFEISGNNPFYFLSCTTVSEEYYKHQMSLARAYYAQDDFLAEKVSIYTNIENGMGILAGANQLVKKFDFSNHIK